VAQAGRLTQVTPQLTIRVLQVAAIIESWIAAAWLFRHVRPNSSAPISTHGGIDDASYLVFAFTLTLHPIVYVFFSFLWIIPLLQPSPLFVPVVILAAICQLLTAWIPHGRNPRLHVLHNIVATSMSAAMPVMTALILATGRLSPAASIVNWLALGCMLLLPLIFISTKRTRENYLWFQSAYILAFQLSAVAIAFSS
jgi:hypothetical protein